MDSCLHVKGTLYRSDTYLHVIIIMLPNTLQLNTLQDRTQLHYHSRILKIVHSSCLKSKIVWYVLYIVRLCYLYLINMQLTSLHRKKLHLSHHHCHSHHIQCLGSSHNLFYLIHHLGYRPCIII